MKLVRIVVFAKAPLAGFAKTRLVPALGKDGAAALARLMLFHTLREASAVGVDSVELCVTPDIGDAAWEQISLPPGIELSNQGEGDLGERLARAAERSVSRCESVLLIGTDCVEMSANLLRAAVRSLEDRDAVMHGTADGGYAMLGLNRCNPFLFHGIPWSTNAVASTTLGRLGQLGWTVHVGQLLHDMDEPQDLKHLPVLLESLRHGCKEYPACATNDHQCDSREEASCMKLYRIITASSSAAAAT